MDPAEEGERLAVLQSLRLADAPPDPSLEALARAASQATGCAVALVTLVDADKAWHVARIGLDVTSTPRPLAFCSEAIRQPGLFEIPDLRLDPRFAQHPLVNAPNGWRHYAAVTLALDGHPLGTLCVLDTRPGPLSEAARDALRTLGDVARDSLAQRRHARLLEEQVERLSDLVRASGDWAWELDADLRLSWVSGEMQTVTGLSPADCLGRPMDAEPLVEGDGQPPRGGGTLLDVLEARQPFSRLLSRLSCPRGELVISRSALPVFDASGRFRGYRGAARDVTSRIEREGRLRDQATHESVHRERSQFLSRVSHELRTPLNAILGFSQLMQLDPPTQMGPKHQQRLDGIQRAGNHLLELINDVLEIVRLEQGSTPMALSPTDLAPLCTSVLADHEAAARQADVTLHLDVPPLLKVRGNARALEQVLHQLLSNAVKYNRPGGQVRCSARPAGPWVRLTITDTGRGLGPDEIGRLFLPFSRPGAERHRIDGSGLGLVLARDFVQAMGGHLEVDSQLGDGSAFHVDLPAVDAVAPAAPLATAAPAPGASRPARTVLYIEDEPLNVLLMQELFKSRPEWTLHVARDGGAGLEMARAQRPDLALVDMNLPDCNGLEVLRRMRADPELASLRCIALSADAMREQIDAALAAGFHDYWTKPIDLTRLVDAVARALGDGPVA